MKKEQIPMYKKSMEIVLFLFPQLNFSAPKEEAYFKMLSPGDIQVLRKKDNKTRVKEKEKKTRLSLLLTKSGSHENVNPESKNPTKSITPAAALKWRESFEEMLDHKDGLETFTTFLKTEFSEENIEFWLDCEEYKKIKSPTELVSKAKKMYAVYIDTEAPKEINIDFSTKTAIKQNILKPTHSCFEAAQSKVYSLMKKDCYPRFLKSDMYFNLTKTLPPPSMSRRRSRSCVFNDRSEAETELGIWL